MFVVKTGLWFVVVAGRGQGCDRIRVKICESLTVVMLSAKEVWDDLQRRKSVYFFILERGDTLFISGAFVMLASWWKAHLSDLFLQLSLARERLIIWDHVLFLRDVSGACTKLP